MSSPQPQDRLCHRSENNSKTEFCLEKLKYSAAIFRFPLYICLATLLVSTTMKLPKVTIGMLMLIIQASYKYKDLFFQRQDVGFCETHAKGWIMFQCLSSRLQGKLNHSWCNFVYEVSESYCCLAWLWKLHRNVAPRKFTYFEKQIAGVTCCNFVTNSLKHVLDVSIYN